jgi:hypothetical protein
MNDPYPFHVPIEIDRVQLRKYLRAKWLLAWMLALSGFGALFGLAGVSKIAEQSPSVGQGFGILAAGCAGGLAVGLLLSVAAYFIFSHWLAGRMARGLEVSVEGPFLRVRQSTLVRTDRKLHFRSIVDYTAVQGGLMHYFGIEALQMTTIAGGQNTALTIAGVKDCVRTRDMLSEIDRLRENSS